MKQQHQALFAILALILTIVGCTSSTPVANDSGNKVTTTKTSQSSFEDGQLTQLSMNSNLDSDRFVNQLRQWTDSESQYSTNAELISVSLKNRTVTLLKENGITIEVDVDRLSPHDRNFLKQAVHAMREQLVQEN